ncbi:MAG: hypothetical protein PHP44_01880 [Kiritimatiellae bacterium]|nr:hypothetical protein [Kiritimatiellia bacterium]MDD4734836.1 hypothetical protein [Kiritimatiellia bacterium]
MHRYSFEEDVSDSVGTADGTLHDGAAISAGRLSLNGVGAYARLPVGDTMLSLDSFSIEAWATADSVDAWARVFDFGSSESTGNAFLTICTQDNPPNGVPRYAITQTDYTGEQKISSSAAVQVGV